MIRKQKNCEVGELWRWKDVYANRVFLVIKSEPCEASHICPDIKHCNKMHQKGMIIESKNTNELFEVWSCCINNMGYPYTKEKEKEDD